MSKPVILAVDDDPVVLAAIRRDLRRRRRAWTNSPAAVGEGAMSIYLVHRYLATI